MKGAKSANEFYAQKGQWQEMLLYLRSILVEFTELEETIKWGVPAYLVHGKIVVGVASFKNHTALWFHQGALLKDEKNLLINAQEGKTSALRQARFSLLEEIDKKVISNYIQESINNQKEGKRIVPQKKTLIIPAELKAELESSNDLKVAFSKLTPGKKREYADHVSDAKRETTRLKRLEKCIPLILEGKGLHDKYKNC